MAFWGDRYKPSNGGWIYALSNESWPGLLKIGKTTTSVEKRAKQLSDIIPTPFKIEYAVRVLRPSQAEAHVHRILLEFRVNRRREFFRVTVEQAKSVMDTADHEVRPRTLEETRAAMERAFSRS